MTDKDFQRAKIVRENIEALRDVFNAIEKIKINDGRERYKPHLKFFNMVKLERGKEVREAATFLFDGVGIYGTEVPIDEHLLECLKEYYQAKLAEAIAELEAI